MTVWITKRLFTDGIFQTEAEQPSFSIPNMIVINLKGKYKEYIHTPFWHKTEEEAKKHAKQMLDKKLSALRKQVTKLENMII
jgi:hypothetical protein